MKLFRTLNTGTKSDFRIICYIAFERVAIEFLCNVQRVCYHICFAYQIDVMLSISSARYPTTRISLYPFLFHHLSSHLSRFRFSPETYSFSVFQFFSSIVSKNWPDDRGHKFVKSLAPILEKDFETKNITMVFKSNINRFIHIDIQYISRQLRCTLKFQISTLKILL